MLNITMQRSIYFAKPAENCYYRNQKFLKN